MALKAFLEIVHLLPAFCPIFVVKVAVLQCFVKLKAAGSFDASIVFIFLLLGFMYWLCVGHCAEVARLWKVVSAGAIAHATGISQFDHFISELVEIYFGPKCYRSLRLPPTLFILFA
jgi:hypothetical protein